MSSKRTDTIIKWLVIVGFFIYLYDIVAFTHAGPDSLFLINLTIFIGDITPLYGILLCCYLVFRRKDQYLSRPIYVAAIIYIITTLVFAAFVIAGIVIFLHSVPKYIPNKPTHF